MYEKSILSNFSEVSKMHSLSFFFFAACIIELLELSSLSF